MARKSQAAAGGRAECLGPAEVASIRRRRWLGRQCGARLARCTMARYDEMRRRGDFGPDPDRPLRRLVAEYRLTLKPESPYLDSLVFDHVITAGSPSPEVAEWGCRQDGMVVVDHYPTLVEAVARAVELKVFIALVVNDALSGRSALLGTAAVARRHFPDVFLRVLGAALPPEMGAHGWLNLPTDTADLDLDEAYRKFLVRMRPGGTFAGLPGGKVEAAGRRARLAKRGDNGKFA